MGLRPSNHGEPACHTYCSTKVGAVKQMPAPALIRHPLKRQFTYVFLVVLLSGGVVGASPAQAEVQRISFATMADGEGQVVRIHSSAMIRAFQPPIVREGMVEVILFNTNLSVPYTHDAPAGPVKAYWVFPQQGHLVLRFQLNTPEVQAKVYPDRGSSDLLLALQTTASVPAQLVHEGQPPKTTTAKPSPWRLDTIVIDAGHGGRDGGAIGVGGIREKDIVLPVALKLGRYLEEYLGVNVIYTRKDDRFIPLKERGHKANTAEGKLFISLHANAAKNRAAYGTETYFLGMHKTDAAQQVMERENSVVHLEAAPNDYDHFNEHNLIRRALTQSAYMRQSEQLAGLVEGQFAERVHRHSRGIKQAGFYVLWGASMPSLLIELGFVTNRKEAEFMKSDYGQTMLASAIFRAVRDYKEDLEKGFSVAGAPQ